MAEEWGQENSGIFHSYGNDQCIRPELLFRWTSISVFVSRVPFLDSFTALYAFTGIPGRGSPLQGCCSAFVLIPGAMPQASLVCPLGRLRVASVFIIMSERDEYFSVYFVVTNQPV